ncbi:uncharacterized protein N7446_004168 [Penicillium canescens]|uniref:Major facilitator superfamily (MFS) profile domain-containing protein n=1 Tax=Penicillium canescens TaxID=5083 RepID=A0AAD6I2E9_PENCN|nr:uncharacterized protein N7446_004168 [Penicillium canescens]KAJ6027232.1 hypothetical protein N7460_012049 [Penicillium canescens]KAJ6067131.1 hypothetical protein N7446_004168 [Penicillium canescens]
MKCIYIANVVIFMAGAAVAGAASDLPAVIVGRIVMGVGGAVFGLLSAIWAVGLVLGCPIWFALASNSHIT